MPTNTPQPDERSSQHGQVVDPWAPQASRRAQRQQGQRQQRPAPQATSRAATQRVDPGAGAPLAYELLRLSNVSGASGGFGRLMRSMFGSDSSAEDLAAAAHEAQAAVTTGRRVAIFSTRGGAGTTTATAALARLFSAVRPDTTAALDLSLGHGSLGLRLGADPAAGRSFAQIVPEATGGRLPTAEQLHSMLVPIRDNLVATASAPAAAGPPPAGSLVRETCANVSRYFPLTLLDCPSGINQATTASALADAHAVLWVVPATMSGIEDALAQLSGPYLRKLVAAGRVVVLVTQLDQKSPVTAAEQAQRLLALGYEAHALEYDAHLAAGARLSLNLLGAERRMALAQLAGRIVTIANAARTQLKAGHRR